MPVGEIIYHLLPLRQFSLLLQQWQLLPHNVHNPRIRKEPAHHIEPLPTSLRQRQRPYVGQRHVADINKGKDGRGGLHGVAYPAGDKVEEALVGGFDAVEGVEAARERAKGISVADCRRVKGGLWAAMNFQAVFSESF